MLFFLIQSQTVCGWNMSAAAEHSERVRRSVASRPRAAKSFLVFSQKKRENCEVEVLADIWENTVHLLLSLFLSIRTLL